MDEHQLAILLAARSQGHQCSSEVMSDEQLIALVAGELDQAKKNEALELIANSPEIYAQWARLLRQKEELDEEYEREPVGQLPLLNKMKAALSSWLDPLRSPTWIGMTAACAVAIFIFLPSSTESKKNKLFDRWQPYLAATGNTPAPQWRGEESASRELPADQHWFEFGLNLGLKKLGDGRQIVGLPSYLLSKEKPEDSSESDLIYSGEITALIYFMCQSNTDIEFFVETNELIDRYSKIQSPWNYSASPKGAEPELIRKQLCTKNNDLLTKLILSTATQ